MIVCIAEKPSVARDIAEVLGAHNKKDGFIEGNGYQVTWTFGHLCTLKEPHEYTPQWKSIYSAVEIVVAGKPADDTAALRYKADKRCRNRKAVQDNRIVDAEGGYDYKLR